MKLLTKGVVTVHTSHLVSPGGVEILKRHPELIDELASRSLLAERFSPAQLRLELQMRLLALTAAGMELPGPA